MIFQGEYDSINDEKASIVIHHCLILTLLPPPARFFAEPLRLPEAEVLDECLARLSTISDPRTELGARARPRTRVSAAENFIVRWSFVLSLFFEL